MVYAGRSGHLWTAGVHAMANGARAERLKSWKEIAAFFGTDERTVRRWESRGLPVRRVPGGARATVYAEVGELETWLKGRGSKARLRDEPPAPAAAGRRGWRTGRAALGALAALLVASAAGLILVQGDRSGVAAERPRPPHAAQDLYLSATYDLERRTPQSLQRARDQFGRAIAEDPAYAEAYAGLASTYLLLREFSTVPDAEAYPRAKEAAERALALDPRLADAHAALGFVTFYWTREWGRGLASLERAIALDPASARARHWYATALLHAGRVDEALAAIGEAQRREPGSRSIMADRAAILFGAGRTAEAVSILRDMEAGDPDFVSPHAYLATIYLSQKKYPAYLSEAEAAARLKGSADQLALVADARRGLARGGEKGMLRAILARQLDERRKGGGSDYSLARTYAALGEGDHALRLLDAAWRQGESGVVALRTDPMLAPLHGDARFRRLSDLVARPSPGRA
jgi:tetratricopeptide (TPR) repeat protein